MIIKKLSHDLHNYVDFPLAVLRGGGKSKQKENLTSIEEFRLGPEADHSTCREVSSGFAAGRDITAAPCCWLLEN